jgi:hypothetical protein
MIVGGTSIVTPKSQARAFDPQAEQPLLAIKAHLA